MVSPDGDLASDVCIYTIALLPEVKQEDFEKHIREEVLPQFELTARIIGTFQVDHHFLKRQSDDSADLYWWQIRLRGELVLSATKDTMFAELDKRVREGLVSFGIPVLRTILQELDVTQTI